MFLLKAAPNQAARKHKKSSDEIEQIKQALSAEQKKHSGKHRAGRFLHRPIVWLAPDSVRRVKHTTATSTLMTTTILRFKSNSPAGTRIHI